MESEDVFSTTDVEESIMEAGLRLGVCTLPSVDISLTKGAGTVRRLPAQPDSNCKGIGGGGWIRDKTEVLEAGEQVGNTVFQVRRWQDAANCRP